MNQKNYKNLFSLPCFRLDHLLDRLCVHIPGPLLVERDGLRINIWPLAHVELLLTDKPIWQILKDSKLIRQDKLFVYEI